MSPKRVACMRKLVVILAVLFGALFTFARADATTIIRLHAGSVQFYYDRFLLEADGNVHVTTSDGMTMSGDSFSMDLKLNRFVLAGHVHVQDPSGSQDGAALADFLDFDRIYFVPIVGNTDTLRQAQGDTGLPDRWTFLNGDFAHPQKGREMPGDTFFFPDLSNEKPYIKTDSAVVGARSYIRFAGNKIDLANGLGMYVPTPSYYVNFSNDQHLGDNSLAGADWDATWELAGNANAISALHFRYDPTNKTYLSFEQHLSGKKAYAVFSVNPMTRPSKFWNMILSDKPSDRFQVRTFTQLHTFQNWLQRPDESGQFSIIQAVEAMPHSFLQLSTQFTNFSLLPPTPLGYEGHGVVPKHPTQMDLSAVSSTHRIGRLPLYESMQYGFGFTHDAYPLQRLGGVNYDTIWSHNLGVQMYVPSVKLGSSPLEIKNYYLNATFQKSRQWNSTPHYIDRTQTDVSVSKMFDRHFLSFLQYEVLNLGDIYSGDLQSKVYPSFVPVVNGVKYPGYAAFRGLSTLHTLSLDLTYSNGGNFMASLLARKHNDFPNAVPGLFPVPPLNVIGQQIQPYYFGQPPYDITADFRARINDHMSVDIARSYYFNFGNQRWSPGFVIQVQQ
jgi:hypothetical protein